MAAVKSSAMRRVSLRNVAAHKLRLALTVIAVVLGTAFISGAFMFTNSLSNSFDKAVRSSFSGVDAVVSNATIQDRDALIASPTVSKVNADTKVGIVVAKPGDPPEALQTRGGSSTVGMWFDPANQVAGGRELVDGKAPATIDEVLVNEKAAEKFKLKVGDPLLLVDPQARNEAKIVGIYSDETDQDGGAKLLTNEQGFLQRYVANGQLGDLLVSAPEGTTPEQTVEKLQTEFPNLEVKTGESLAEEITREINDALSFVNYFLVAFGLVGLLVGTFLIANTFSMIVAQRTKEFALLRALGASRRQITQSVTFEAFIVGMLGSALGILAGIGLVAIIKAGFAAQGTSLGDGGLGLSPTAVFVPLLIGTIVTIFSAWAPARRAGAIDPVEAMRSSESATSQPLKVRTIIGAVLLAVGFICIGLGVALDNASTSQRATLVGVAAVAVILGFFLASPALSLPIVPPFGRLIGAPFGAVGRLASTNTRRNPRRTATTSFALALGVALVTAIGMLGETMKSSVDDAVSKSFTADYVLTGPSTGSFPVPAEAAADVAKTEGVASVIVSGAAPVQVNGKGSSLVFGGTPGSTAVVEGNPQDLAKMRVLEGNPDLSEGGVIVTEAYAKEKGLKLGDSVDVVSTLPPPPGQPGPATGTSSVRAIITDSDIYNSVAVSLRDVQALLPPEAIKRFIVGVRSEEGFDQEKLRENLERAVAPFVVLQVKTNEEMAGDVSGMIDQMLAILYGLLALAVIIAVLGILNTLTLSVIERRQEIGMLRAVGTLRKQIRTLITLESVQISLFGALTGTAIGLGLGWAFIKVLSGDGLSAAVLPWGIVASMLGGSILVGLLAAIWPAQRAAKTPPLEAIAD